jgi:hypothetical protein
MNSTDAGYKCGETQDVLLVQTISLVLFSDPQSVCFKLDESQTPADIIWFGQPATALHLKK